MTVVKHLVELHGGSVVVKSAGPGRGATFAVMLPVAALKEGEITLGRASAPSTELANKSLPQLSGLSVLVVEDDEDSRDLLARTLENAGATVTTACSAVEGLLKFETSATDVIVGDIGMPEKNGYMFIETIRSKPAKGGGRVLAVALPAYSRVEDRVRARCAGFPILLPKPADSSVLVVTVAALAKQFK